MPWYVANEAIYIKIGFKYFVFEIVEWILFSFSKIEFLMASFSDASIT